ncbi:MAG: tRNA (N(6)-L-threonylcarbamoyladenosine(37)-C(2))-methylthiotransferase MtaB, partial [Oscillospiraceae bacterium]|nr:tRNA (N(6)-L-threonylcarbamoyladenosine(37)-C(2))-methylthiotransferase MtaB [Oscillospiraceae bacterium]
MTAAFFTLGCKVNRVDSDTLRGKLEASGFLTVAPEDGPDVLVLNSCAVTAESERKTRQKLRHFRASNRDAILVLTGCAVQVNDQAAAAYPEADILLGHRDAGDLAECIDEFLRTHQPVVRVTPHARNESLTETLPRESGSRTRANLKIEDGCDRWCSYCIIPRARGGVRSKPLQQVHAELAQLDKQGFCEVV